MSKTIQKTSTPNTTANSQEITKKNRIKSKSDEEDGLLFGAMLGENKFKENWQTMQEMHNSQNSQMFLKIEEEKKEDYKIKSISQEQAKSIENIQQAENSYHVEFCKALQENHEKHNFEVNLPKIGRFSIGTERAGNKLHFSVSSKEKIACDWLKTRQTEIENNVGQDLQMDVSLGIEYVA